MARHSDWDTLAQSLHAARIEGYLRETPAPEDMPQAIAECYYVQDRAIALWDEPPRAWKLGAPALAAQQGAGLTQPFSGPVLPGMLLASPAELDVTGFACHMFEPEIAITLGEDIEGPIDAATARAAIASFHPAIELINFRSKDGRARGAKGMITDLGANGALVLGDPIPDPADDYWAMVLDVRINGATIANRTPPPPETDIPSLLAWFSGHITARGYTLRSGDVITTGSQAGLLPYAPGDLIEADFGPAGLASVQC